MSTHTDACFDPDDDGVVCELGDFSELFDAYKAGFKAVLLIALPAVVASLAVAARNHHRCTRSRP